MGYLKYANYANYANYALPYGQFSGADVYLSSKFPVLSYKQKNKEFTDYGFTSTMQIVSRS
jgi:hypothetical protein